MKKNLIKKITIIVLVVAISIYHSVIIADAVENKTSARFNNITVNQGLSQGSVYCILQDNNGYMWFGTNDGLNRYNGYSFDVLKGSENEIDKLTTGIVGSLIEDDKGYIWAGTSSGLSKINSRTLEVERIGVDVNDKKKISNNHISELKTDAAGDIWIGTENGLNKYDSQTGEVTKYFHDENDEKSLSNNSITSITEGLKDEIWVGTKDGLNILNKKDGSVRRVNKKNEGALRSDNILKVYKDCSNNIWISTQEEGVIKFNAINKKFEDVKEINNDFGYEKYAINSMYEDLDNNLWLGSKGGLIKYSKIDKSVTKYKNKYYDQESLVNNSVQSVYRDKEGLMWIGTYNGISIVNPEEQFDYYKNDPLDENSLSSNSIGGMYEDYEGELWIGTTNDGLNKLNRETGKVTRYKLDNNNQNTISSNTIYDITGNNETIWIGTKNGLNKLNKKTGEIKKYFSSDKENSLCSNDIKSIYLYEDRYLWIGTREGMDILDVKEDKFINLDFIFKNGNTGENFVRRIFKDSKNNIWIGMGWNGGLIRIDISSGKITYYKNEKDSLNSISNNAIKGITEDLNGKIWVTTSEGINSIDYETGEIKRLSEKDGLINNYAYGILVDETNNIWTSTNGGISKFNQKDNNFSNYTILDGLQSNEFNGTSEIKTRDGEMFFGGINGVTAFYPRKIKDGYKEAAKVSIGNFDVFNNKEVALTDQINLKHTENNFSIEFFMPSYSKLGNWSYEYILEGFDEEWISASTRNYARYTNIPSGKYTFKVRARFGLNDISEINSFEIKVNKAWYKSNIAYLIYFIIITSIIYLIVNRVKILENMVSDRTEKLNNELKEKEKIYKELLKIEKFRNTYLVNLSHELRTPLNVILSSEQLIDKLNEEDKIDKEGLNKYMKIIRKNSKGLLKVINDLIDTSKISSGAYVLNYEKCDIVYLVEEIALSMKTYIEDNGLELIIDPEIEEKIIDCSKDDIERCVINLISNAVKFTEKGRIYISIKEDNNNVEIIIEDSGVGISKEHQSMIFDRFATLETGISSKHCSSGIGLTLVKNIVELHKGSISLESEIGVGSKFKIKLPINR